VYALDLTLFLPLCVAAAVLLWRNQSAGPVLAAVVLIKKATLGLAIAAMIIFQRVAGEPVDAIMTTVFATITVIDLGVLALGATRVRDDTGGWLRLTTSTRDRLQGAGG
jgi:hypothetical protein